ncbi:LuxR C-terminal-related transcriptional regulator [Crossiella cryophila]|uniref:DNA-binding NarL/FixJ family response regulator n=1 Tax=Crossiella cryophila TaxID=43355 RepID=A0A7W7CGK4_9PSEU|nr:response regulator transcription factor [Crossiella cryophila]MBB4680833.1 DNA-binding NarL/FixJ family response regulator [Crossiella cryophila]
MDLNEPGPRPRRVVVLDRRVVVCLGLAAVILECPNLLVVGKVTEDQRALTEIERLRPDLVLASAALCTRVDLLSAVTTLRHQPKVLVLTETEDSAFVLQALLAGANGCVSLHAPPRDIVQAMRAAVSGQTPLTAAVAARMAMAARTPRRTVPLSLREIDVLRHAAAGHTNAQIAKGLAVSEATVKTYWRRIFKKLSAQDRTSAVTIALRQNSIALED